MPDDDQDLLLTYTLILLNGDQAKSDGGIAIDAATDVAAIDLAIEMLASAKSDGLLMKGHRTVRSFRLLPAMP